jgi:hypothetical protein
VFKIVAYSQSQSIGTGAFEKSVNAAISAAIRIAAAGTPLDIGDVLNGGIPHNVTHIVNTVIQAMTKAKNGEEVPSPFPVLPTIVLLGGVAETSVEKEILPNGYLQFRGGYM